MKDQHFWIKDVVNRLPIELLPKVPTWSSLLTAITQLKTERNNAIDEAERLKESFASALMAPSCEDCANNGKVNGLSQESFCSQCIFGSRWKSNHFRPKGG